MKKGLILLAALAAFATTAIVRSPEESRADPAPALSAPGSIRHAPDLSPTVFQEKTPTPRNTLTKLGMQRGKGYKALPPAVRAQKHAEAFRRHDHRQARHVKNLTAPPTFDCVALGWVPPVRDQGSCGSCYEVSAADAVTCCFVKAGWAKADDSFKISDQFGLDCKDFGGCNGGDEAEVIDYIKTHGFPAEYYLDASGKKVNDYPPYQARSMSCRLPSGAKLWKIQDWGYATGDQSDRPATVDEIKAALMHYGTLSIALDAGGDFDGNGPVCESLGSSIDHAITMVGWDDSKGKGGAFKCRNNWGDSWQDGGYRWIGYAASRQIVEIIWLSAVALPPPPPPPPPVCPAGQHWDATLQKCVADGPLPPPPPGPSMLPSLSISGPLPTGTYQLAPMGAAVVTKDTTISDLFKMLKTVAETPPGPPCCGNQAGPAASDTITKDSELNRRMERLESNQAIIAESLLKIQEALLKTKEKK